MVQLQKMPSSAWKRALILNVFVFLKSDGRVSFFSLEWHIHFYFCSVLLSNEPYLLITFCKNKTNKTNKKPCICLPQWTPMILRCRFLLILFQDAWRFRDAKIGLRCALTLEPSLLGGCGEWAPVCHSVRLPEGHSACGWHPSRCQFAASSHFGRAPVTSVGWSTQDGIVPSQDQGCCYYGTGIGKPTGPILPAACFYK